jgi:hypothetical protein
MPWAPDYATIVQVRDFVRIPDTADDAQVAVAVSTASRSIDRTTGRQFGSVSVAESRLSTPWRDPIRDRWVIPIDDLATLTGLSVLVDVDGDGTPEAPLTGVSPRPDGAPFQGRVWTELIVPLGSATVVTSADSSVLVTAVWGWPAVPTAITTACILQASRLLARRDAPLGVAGSPSVGSEIRLLERLDPDVLVAVDPYIRDRPVRAVFA